MSGRRAPPAPRQACSAMPFRLPPGAPLPLGPKESDWQLGGNYGRLGRFCKLVDIALNARLCFVLCLGLPIKNRPIARIYRPTANWTPKGSDKVVGRPRKGSERGTERQRKGSAKGGWPTSEDASRADFSALPAADRRWVSASSVACTRSCRESEERERN